MYQLLLVEDEDIIRTGLRHMIDKLNLTSVQVLEASNGLEALEIAKTKELHIVITDIHLPFLDGLELIEKLKMLLPSAEIIILSGYSKFEYARRAISLGVKEYLVKPINKNQLTAVLQQSLQHLSSEDFRLKQELLGEILSGTLTKEQLAPKLIELAHFYPQPRFVLLSFRAIHFTASSSFEQDLHLLEKQLSLFFIPIFQFVSDYGYAYYLLNLSGLPDTSLLEFQKSFETNGNDLPMGISDIISASEDLPTLLAQARSALDNRLFYFHRKCFSYQDYHMAKTNTVFSPILGDTILLALERGNGAAAELIKDFFLKLLENAAVTTEFVSFNVKALLYYLFSTKMVQKALPDVDLFLSTADNFADFSNTIIEHILLLEVQPVERDMQNAAVTQSIQYVRNYFYKDITLVYIANFVSMNDSYFSTLFKKETGIGFVQFLQDVRIQNARKFLLDPSLKIYEVAQMAGFRDEKYFSKIFKKLTGVTPGEYRNSLPMSGKDSS